MDEEEREKDEEAEKVKKVKILNTARSRTKKDPWKISTGILGIIVVVLIVSTFKGGITGGIIGTGDIGKKVLDFADSRGVDAELVGIEDEGSLYKVTLSIDGQPVPVYITKDGKYLVSSPIPLGSQVAGPTQQQPDQPPADVPKSDKPKVELFIMTHCPYGTQAEKGMLPVFELLGDKIDSSIKFVHYFLHDPENDETPLQICLREEQPEKYLDYLKCFLEDGDSERCLTEAGINKAKLNSCIANSAEGYYASDSELSQGYGVRGSPTLVINGQQAGSGRSPAAYLSTICSAFNEQPEECKEELNSANPSPGFGYTASAGGSTSAQC